MVDRWSTWTSDVYQCVYFAVLLVTDVLIFGLEAVGELGEAAFRLVLSIKGWPPKLIAKIAPRKAEVREPNAIDGRRCRRIRLSREYRIP